MTIQEIIYLVLLCVAILGGIISIVIACIRGEMKKFIEEKMVEVEQQNLDGAKKLEYVLVAVKEKYKIVELVLNVKKFVEHIIALSKQINAK